MIDRNAKKPETESGFETDDLEQQESFEFGEPDDNEGEDEAEEEYTGPQLEVASTPVGSTPVDFARMGITQMAYIRQALVNAEPMWAIFSAAGDPLGAAASFDQAWAAVKQHNLEPMRVH